MKNLTNSNRRSFFKASAIGLAYAGLNQSGVAHASSNQNPIRLGGPIHEKYSSPEEWVAAVKRLGFSAAYCPIDHQQGDDVVKAYADAARRADIIIAEVGAWSNPIDPDDAKRNAALQKCKNQLALADRIGAECCVNITGSVGEKWDGHDPANLTQDTFDLIVETTRNIIDAVKPTRTFYTLETMPWAYPDSADSYLRLIKAIDRKQCAAHLDPVNIVSSPQRYYANGAMIRECFQKLSPFLKSCHAKDILMQQQLTVHLDEIRPGLGNLDYKVFLQELAKLKDIPLMLEHLSTAQEYKLAADHIRSVAKQNNIKIKV